MRWWVVAVAGCGIEDDWSQPPAPREDDVPADVCVGYGEHDGGDDGTVGYLSTHVVADTWDVLTRTSPSDPDFAAVTRSERDERGDPVREEYEARDDGLWSRQVTTWERDDEGRELVMTEVATDNLDDLSSAEGEARHEYTWEGPLLVRIDGFWDGALAQVNDYRYDPDGRRIEDLVTRNLLYGSGDVDTATRTFFDPAPSLDHHTTQDTTTDGVIDSEADWFYDDGGRPVRMNATTWSEVFGTTVWLREYGYDEAGREVRVYQEQLTDGQPPQILEVLTTWDPDGRVLEELTVATWGTERTTWSWSCP